MDLFNEDYEDEYWQQVNDRRLKAKRNFDIISNEPSLGSIASLEDIEGSQGKNEDRNLELGR